MMTSDRKPERFADPRQLPSVSAPLITIQQIAETESWNAKLRTVD